jgi:hypothetical protein
MRTTLQKSGERGRVNFGWLDSHHSFSFGHFYDPAKINFGVLRVLNDDIVSGGRGFGTHPHDNMEIISIPLKGDLEHEDSTGTKAVIKENDVQIMSAGTGIQHSEKNHDPSEKVNFLQIWVLPKNKNIAPRYDQKTFDPELRQNMWQVVVAPDEESAVWINQDAWFSLGNFTKGHEFTYDLKKQGNGVFIFVIEGSVMIDNIELNKRDSLAITDVDALNFNATDNAKLLIIDVPMLS